MAIDAFALTAGEGPCRFSWLPSSLLLTPAANLQGGAGLGAAVAAMEAVTGQPAIWATAQYLSFAQGTDALDLDVTVEVAGHHTTQARCVLSRDGTEVLTAHAALGRRQLDFEGVWSAPPAVPRPEDCQRYRFFESGRGGIGDLAEFRLAQGRQLDGIMDGGARGSGHSFALWIRCWHGARLASVADLAFIGDFMPIGFADAMGAPYAGNSLDNTIRVGHLVPTEWILLAVHVQQVTNGFGYGHAELWAEDGTLLGDVSQSVVLRLHSSLRGGDRQRSI